MTKKTNTARREAFFRALAETGNQTIAAERAKVSRSWVASHRASDPEFRMAMIAAVDAAKVRLRAAAQVAPSSSWGSLDGEELVVRGANGRRVQIARARLKQWTPRIEARFLSVLAATCNVKAACDAVGLSPASAYQHAARWADFEARWKAAVEEGYFRIEMQLIERATGGMSPAGVEPGPFAPIPETDDDGAFHQLYMHQHKVRAKGKPQGRKPKPRPNGREEMMAFLMRKLDQMEARKARGELADQARRDADRREWDARGAR